MNQQIEYPGYIDPQGWEYRGPDGTSYRIPVDTGNALVLWIGRAARPGRFLSAILANDLRGAFANADNRNFPNIPAIVAWLWNHAPSTCWGSPERMAAWRGMLADERTGSDGASIGDDANRPHLANNSDVNNVR